MAVNRVEFQHREYPVNNKFQCLTSCFAFSFLRKERFFHYLGVPLLTFAFVFILNFSYVCADASLDETLTGLLRDFSDPGKKESSDLKLCEIFKIIDKLIAEKKYEFAGRYIHQLEGARFGRTPSLYRFPRKQNFDTQLVKIWKYIADFYRICEDLEKKEGNFDEAGKSGKKLKILNEKLQTAMESIRKQNGKPHIFEEDTVASHSADILPIINIPTLYFIFLPSSGVLYLPCTYPFELVDADPTQSKMGLNEKWYWNIGSWQELHKTLISGISPTGHVIIWFAGAFTKNKAVACNFSNNHWILEPVSTDE